MASTQRIAAVAMVFSAALVLGQQQELVVKPGTPLYIRLEGKTPIRAGQAVRGVLVHPLYVFDREVLSAGAEVSGSVTEVKPASRSVRLRSYLNGRLRTPEAALIVFDGILPGDGRTMALRTSATTGSSVVRVANSSPPAGKRGAIGEVRHRVGDLVANHEAVRTARALADRQTRRGVIPRIVAGLKNEARSYWPFGVQHLPQGTAFSAVLSEPLAFEVGVSKRDPLGVPPPTNTLVRARLTAALSSATARAGTPVQAVTMEPVFSENGALLMAAGTEVRGEVTRAVPARRFGRNGKLQVRFTEFDSGADKPSLALSGTLEAVETDSRAGIQLDAEGLASIPVAKKRFIYPAIAVGLATNAVPSADDALKAQGGAPGWSGFGLVGTAAALATHTVAGPLGWWGVASSTYSNLLRKANELEFPAHTVLEIRVGRPAAPSPVVAEASARQLSQRR